MTNQLHRQDVRRVLLHDGWHRVQPGTFTLGPGPFVTPDGASWLLWVGDGLRENGVRMAAAARAILAVDTAGPKE